MLRMDQVHVVRHKVLVEGVAIRRVAREMGISRNTVRNYLQVSEPVLRERGARARPVLEKVAPRMDGLLDEWATRTTFTSVPATSPISIMRRFAGPSPPTRTIVPRCPIFSSCSGRDRSVALFSMDNPSCYR